MILDSFTVFCADSINCGSDGGEFGRFSPNTKTDTVRLCCDDESGEWWIGLPFGSRMTVSDLTEEDTRDSFEVIRAAAQTAKGYDVFGWRTDRAAVDADSRADAIQRHNASCSRPTYEAKFGQPIAAE